MKKNTANLNGTVELKAIAKARYDGEKWGQIIFKAPNCQENAQRNNVGKGAFPTELKNSIHGGRDFLVGKWIVEGDFHLYSKISEVMATGSIGLVKSTVKEIADAKKFGERFAEINVPGHGVITFEMPLKRDKVSGLLFPYYNCLWLAMYTTGANAGKLKETDTNMKYSAQTLHYHNAIESLYNGQILEVMACYTKNFTTGVISKVVHDEAERVATMLNDKDFNADRFLEEQKQLAFDHDGIDKDQNYGDAILEQGEEKVQQTVAQTIVYIGKDQMNVMAVPSGFYFFVDDNGKPKSSVRYSVSTDRDRVGLTRRGDVVKLVKVS